MLRSCQLLLVALVLSFSGCHTIEGYSYPYRFKSDITGLNAVQVPDDSIFRGVERSVEAIQGEYSDSVTMQVFACLDLPFSAGADTLTLPIRGMQLWQSARREERLRDFESLKEMLEEGDRWTAVHHLGRLAQRDRRARDLLLKMAEENSDPSESDECLHILVDNKICNGRILALLESHALDPIERKWAIPLIESLAVKHRGAAELFCDLLSDKSAEYPGFSRSSLEDERNLGVYHREICERLLTSKSPNIRCEAALFYLDIDSTIAKPVLREVIGEVDVERQIKILEFMPLNCFEVAQITTPIKAALQSQKMELEVGALRLLTKWAPRSQLFRDFVAAQCPFNEEASQLAAIRYIQSFSMRDELQLRALLWGLHIPRHRALSERVLASIDNGHWGLDWVQRKRRLSREIMKKEPSLIPFWYRQKSGLVP